MNKGVPNRNELFDKAMVPYDTTLNNWNHFFGEDIGFVSSAMVYFFTNV